MIQCYKSWCSCTGHSIREEADMYGKFSECSRVSEHSQLQITAEVNGKILRLSPFPACDRIGSA